ncbi:MAG: VCBS repeat-containing protein, partial [Planctomycetota bacterium]
MQPATHLAALAVCSCLAAQLPPFAQSSQPLPARAGQAIGAADFEGDGDTDLFTTKGVLLNRRGFFESGPSLPASFVPTTNVYCAAIADLTGDGRVDLLIGRAGGSPSGLAILAAPAPGGTSFTALPAAFPGASTMHAVAIGDFDGDGDPDVFAATTSTASPSMQLFL